MRQVFRFAFVLVAAGALASCESTTAPRESFSASATSTAVRLSNGGKYTVFYLMLDPGLLALLDYVPCTSRSVGCDFVAARGTVDAPRSKIIGNREDLKEALVLYWTVDEGIMGDRLVSQGSLHVALPPPPCSACDIAP